MENNNCQYTDSDIWNYYSNLLSRNEEADMQEHILACNHCKQRLYHLRGIAESLDDNEDTDMPSTEEPIGIKKKYSMKRYLILAASAVAAIVLLLEIIHLNKGENYEGTEHPIDNIKSPSYSRGDTLTSDSTDIVFELDTLSIDQ